MQRQQTVQQIEHLSVIGGFLDGLRIKFGAGLNTIIGARGTGKTTAVEFIGYALDSLPSREHATDVINSGGPGYRLQEWITVEVGTRAAALAGAGAKSDSPVVDGCDDPQDDDDSPDSDGLNERQSWAVSQLKQGVQLQIRHVIDRFGCSSTTAKRDLTVLKTAGLVRFTGSARSGHYQLTSAGRKRLVQKPR